MRYIIVFMLLCLPAYAQGTQGHVEAYVVSDVATMTKDGDVSTGSANMSVSCMTVDLPEIGPTYMCSF